MKTHLNHKQRGAALIVGMILLAIITLLAVVGMNISNAELASATNEQLRTRAFQTAETGIERGSLEIFEVGTAECAESVSDPTVVLDEVPTDQFETVSNFRGEATMTDGFGKNYIAFHYSIDSDGIAPRNTRVQHRSGAYVVNASAGQDTYGPLKNWADPSVTGTFTPCP